METTAPYVARTPEDVLATVPLVLGFEPEDSLVLLTFGAAHPFHARVDLPREPDDVRAVFDAWVQSTGKTRAVLDSKRRARIVGALKNFTVDELVDAVRGWRHSPHHRGENERRTVYNDLDLLLRDAARIEKFRDLERGAAMPAPPRVSKSHTNISAVADRLREVEREQERSRNGAQAADRQLLP